jgi:hypothetical protein
VRALTGLFGFALGGSGDDAAQRPQDQPPDRVPGDPNPVRGYQGMGGYPTGPGYPGGFGAARGGGRGFSLGVQYSSSRTARRHRPHHPGGQRNP